MTALAILSPWLLFILYAAAMHLKHVRDDGKLTKAQAVLGYPWVALGLVIDVAVNVVICTPLFMEMPREWTVSSRLWRLSNGDPGWRQKLALALRAGLLDSLDPSGIHKG